MLDLDRLDGLYAMSTPAPWFYAGQDDIEGEMHMVRAPWPEEYDRRRDALDVSAGDGISVADVSPRNPADYQFIIAVFNAYPELRDELAKLRKENAKLRKALVFAEDAIDQYRKCSSWEELMRFADSSLADAAVQIGMVLGQLGEGWQEEARNA